MINCAVRVSLRTPLFVSCLTLERRWRAWSRTHHHCHWVPEITQLTLLKWLLFLEKRAPVES